MNTFSWVKSRASNKGYVRAQARMTGLGQLHVQIAGPHGNRDYGYSEHLDVASEFASWFRHLDRQNKSLAGTSRTYSVVQLAPRETHVVNIQVMGESLNRDYGAAIEVTDQGLWEYLHSNGEVTVTREVTKLETVTVNVFVEGMQAMVEATDDEGNEYEDDEYED